MSDDEHIVSTVMLGPVKLQKYDTRLAIDADETDRPTFTPCACSSAPNKAYSVWPTPA